MYDNLSENIDSRLFYKRGIILKLFIIIAISINPVVCETSHHAEITVDPGESIQSAIDEAKDGDVIYVKSGVYKESINVTKQVKLIGIEQPVIDAKDSENAVTLSVNGTIFDGFRTTGSSSNGIYILSSHNYIANNTASDAIDAIFLEKSHGNTICFNQANGGGLFGQGIVLNCSSSNLIMGNSAASSLLGIGIYLAESSNNTISKNSARNGGIVGLGIVLANNSNNNYILKNEAVCGWNGIGISLMNSAHNLIEGNNASTTCWGWRSTWTVYWGNGINLQNSSKNLLKNNSASNGYFGIYLTDSDENDLSGNDAAKNLNGIGLIGSKRNKFVDNTAKNNSEYGLGFLGSCEGNSLVNNTIFGSKYGIYFQDSSHNSISSNNSLYGNSINKDSLRSVNSWEI